MTPDERNLITGLFDRLRTAEANSPAKDHDAEELIRQLATQNPGAPYLLTQTLLVQEHALANAQTRIQALERQVAQARQQPSTAPSGGGFLSGLFGHGSTPPPAPQPTPQAPPPMPVQTQAPPYPSTVNMPASSGGGFLRTALTTAAGVAGGAVLFQGIESLLGHNSGPFGSGLGSSGGGGFLGSDGPREVVNNYYGDNPAGAHEHGGAGGGDDLGGNVPAGAADQPSQPGYEDARFDDGNFDKGNPFDQPATDNSLFNTPDNSSVDNNFDLDNTDASGGGDFVGGDNDSSDDNGTV